MDTITAYNPCKNKVNSGTTYQQQRRYYITKKNDLTCPQKIFRRDLIKQIKTWRELGDRIILFMDDGWCRRRRCRADGWRQSASAAAGPPP